MVGKFLTIHKATKYRGIPHSGFIGEPDARLCNSYDNEGVATTIFNLEVTCKSCRRILEAHGTKERG